MRLVRGLAGSIGMTIADLMDPVYITGAPKTFVLKLCIGLITGLVAHKIAKINETNDKKYVFKWSLIASIAGLAFNVIADPIVWLFLQTVHSWSAPGSSEHPCKIKRRCYICKCNCIYNPGCDYLQCSSSSPY